MLVEALINWFMGGIVWMVDAITGHIDFSAMALESVLANLLAMNYWLPLSELASFIGVLIALGPVNMAASFTSWILVGVIRGGQSKA